MKWKFIDLRCMFVGQQPDKIVCSHHTHKCLDLSSKSNIQILERTHREALTGQCMKHKCHNKLAAQNVQIIIIHLCWSIQPLTITWYKYTLLRIQVVLLVTPSGNMIYEQNTRWMERSSKVSTHDLPSLGKTMN